jgi:DNA polymerase III subunit alpha
MPFAPFVHLHNRSEYSLLKSALRVRDLVRLAAEAKMPAVALTDRMTLHAGVRF